MGVRYKPYRVVPRMWPFGTSIPCVLEGYANDIHISSHHYIVLVKRASRTSSCRILDGTQHAGSTRTGTGLLAC